MANAYTIALAPFVESLSSAASEMITAPGDPMRQAAIRSARDQTNIFRYSDSEATVDIHLTTIHSVKGETHDATLVLETFYRSYDLSKALELGFGTSRATPSDGVLNHARRCYVGASRPRPLLFLALCRERVDASMLNALESSGWNLHHL